MRDSGGSTQINAKNMQTSHEQVQETCCKFILLINDWWSGVLLHGGQGPKKGVMHCGTSYFKMQSNPIHNVLKIL